MNHTTMTCEKQSTWSLVYLNEYLVHRVCCIVVSLLETPVWMFMVPHKWPRHVRCCCGGIQQRRRLGQIKSCSLSKAEGEDSLWSGCFNAESRDCHLFLAEWFIFSHCVPSVIIDPLLNWANPFANKLWKYQGMRGQETLRLEVFIKMASPSTCEWQPHFLKKLEWCLPMLIAAMVLWEVVWTLCGCFCKEFLGWLLKSLTLC